MKKVNTVMNPDEIKISEVAMELVSYHRTYFENAIGRILTLIEASMPEGSQREACKNLARQQLWQLCDENQRTTYRKFDSWVDDKVITVHGYPKILKINTKEM